MLNQSLSPACSIILMMYVHALMTANGIS